MTKLEAMKVTENWIAGSSPLAADKMHATSEADGTWTVVVECDGMS